jgi:hypothetical protein
MDFDVHREKKGSLYHRIASFEGGTHEEKIEKEDRERDGKKDREGNWNSAKTCKQDETKAGNTSAGIVFGRSP